MSVVYFARRPARLRASPGFPFLLLFSLLACPASGVVYVNANATGTVHDGTSWATAFLTVQAGVDAAPTPGEIWVAASAPAAEAYVENITLKQNITLYGGFNGTETAVDQRNSTTNVTVLAASDEIAVYIPATGVVMDGFTVRGGYYGLRIENGSLSLANCTVGPSEGDGIFLDSGTALLYLCTVKNNDEAGVSTHTSTVLTVSNCLIQGNGRGLVGNDGSITVVNSNLTGNYGKACEIYGGTANLTFCTITGNVTGVSIDNYGSGIVANCIVAYNGTGIFRPHSEMALILTHNDVYGNAIANYVNIADPTGEDGNISENPLLGNPYHDVRLMPDSPCIDVADDSLVQSGWTDIDGQARIQGSRSDIGADESDGSIRSVPSLVRYVKPAGDDANDGLSWAAAKKTVQGALAVAQGGDEVWVAAGTYVENSSVPPGVALYGGFAGTETSADQRDWRTNVTTLVYDDSEEDEREGTVTLRSVWVIVDGFSVINGSVGISVSGGAAVISNCIITDNSHGIYANYCLAVISGCVLHRNEEGISFINESTARITNCTITSGGTGLVIRDTRADVLNCTISGNRCGVFTYEYNAVATLTNNIVAFNGTGLLVESSEPQIALSHNDVCGNITNYSGIADPTGTNGNISLDPLFSNRYHDVHIQPGSPCINAGDDSGINTLDTDIDGQARLQGDHVDIGSDESDGTTWTEPGVVRYVKPTGDDSNDGLSWASAKQTVAGAVASAQGSDEIWVAQGVYKGRFEIPAGVSLFGGFTGAETARNQRDWRANATTLDGNQGDCVGVYLMDAVLDGFTVRNSNIGIYVQYGNIRVVHCNLIDNGTGLSGNSSFRITVDNCLVNRNLVGLRVEYLTKLVLRNCAVIGNSRGVYAECGQLTAANCTFSANAVGLHLYESGAVLVNCICAFNGKGVSRVSGSEPVTLTCCDVWGNVSGNFVGIPDPTGTGGNISQDPLMANPYHDVHIQPGSPCKDAGDDSVVDDDSTDIDGQPRFQGDDVDIGCDETDGTTWTIPVRTWYVKPTGDDANDGLSWATAKRTVDAALDSAGGPDEVWVAKGIYEECVSVPAGVNLYGGFNGGETGNTERNWKLNTTLFQGPQDPGGEEGFDADVVTLPALDSTLDGFGVRYGSSGIVVVANGTVANCSVSDASDEGIYLGTDSHALVRGCSVANCDYGISCIAQSATLMNCIIQDCRYGVVSNSSLFGATPNASTSIDNCALSGSDIGITLIGDGSMRNCTLTGNDRASTLDEGTFSVTNCIAAFNGTGFEIGDSADVTLTHNDVYGNTSNNYTGIDDPTGTNGNISQDPLFASRLTGNYRLSNGSPCINTGDDTVVGSGETDLDGKPRIFGVHVDMGAWEFSGTVPYSLAEVTAALKTAGGLLAIPAGDVFRLDVMPDGAINIIDAARLARKVAGLDPNP